MSIMPILFRDSFMDDFLDDLVEFPMDHFYGFNRCPYIRRGCQRPNSQIRKETQAQDGSFQVSIDVQNFKPEEIAVKMSDNYITVEGKHEEKQDEHGFVSRHFVRKYLIPEGHDLEKVASSLSSDGVLTIKAPRLALPAPAEMERTIPITQTGKPVKQIESKDSKENKNDSK